MSSLRAELFEPAEYLEQRGRPGWFATLIRRDGRTRQDTYQLTDLPAVVAGLYPDVDTWITQATFRSRNRRAVNLRDVGLLFSDLDTYHSEGLANRAPEEQAELLVAYCTNEGLAAPSIVLFSGRGLQAKWLLTEAQGPIRLFEWNQAQLALTKLLTPFCLRQCRARRLLGSPT